MIIKGILEEDFINYKQPSMFIAFPNCSFKCEKECGIRCCQNSELATSPDIEIEDSEIVERYLGNDLTNAIILGGLEPFDTFLELEQLVHKFRDKTDDTIVIYTGYNENEIEEQIQLLSSYKNIIVKFGRYIPNTPEIIDDVLGIKLASNNQYARQIS